MMGRKENNKENVHLTTKQPLSAGEKQFGVALVCNTWEAGLEQFQGCSLHC